MKKQLQIFFSLLVLLISMIVLNNSPVCSLQFTETPSVLKENGVEESFVSSAKSTVEKADLVYWGEPWEFHDLVYRGEEISVLFLTQTTTDN